MKNCIIVCIFIQVFFFSTTAIYPQQSQDDENPHEVVIQSGHYQGGIDHIESISYSPEGKFLASAGGNDQNVIIWHMQTGKELKRFDLGVYVDKVRFSKNGKYIAVKGYSKDRQYKDTIKLWNIETGEHIESFDGISFSFSPDGTSLATCGGGKSIRIWNIKTGRVRETFQNKNTGGYDITYSPDGKLIAAIYNKEIILWDVKQKRVHKRLEGHNGDVTGVSFSPKGQRLVSCSRDKTVRLWDIETGKQLRVLYSHDRLIADVAYSPSGEFIASGSWDQSAVIYNVQQHTIVKVFRDIPEYLKCICFSPDEKKLAVSGDTIVELAIDRETVAKTLSGKIMGISAVEVSHDGKYIAAGCRDKTIKLWDFNNLKLSRTLRGHTGNVNTLQFSRDGTYLISGSEDATIRIWDPERGKEIRTLTGHEEEIRSLCTASGGKYIISASGDGTIKVWLTSTGELLETYRGKYDYAMYTNSIDMSPIDNTFAIAESGSVSLYDFIPGGVTVTDDWFVKKHDFEGESNQIKVLQFSPDGKYIASGSNYDFTYNEPSTISLYNPTKTEIITSMQGHRSDVKDLAFSKDGTLLASAGNDRTVRIWDVKNGNGIYTFEGFEAEVESVCFSPDNRYVVAGGGDGTVRIINIENKNHAALMSDREGHWIVYTEDGYYDSSTDNGGLIAVRRGLDIFDIEDFAAQYNRPDLIMERLGF